MLARKVGLRFVASIILVTLILGLASSAQAYFAPSNGQGATRVLGQPNFTSSACVTTQSGLCHPDGVAVDPMSHKVFVSDLDNNRVLRFSSVYALTNGAAAEAVLGQPDFTSYFIATTQSGMYEPTGVLVDTGGRLWVVDSGNSRVLRFDNAVSKPNGAKADSVLGEPDFTTNNCVATQSIMCGPGSMAMDTSGRLWVADANNNRVLRFDSAASKPNGAKADGVLGQNDFTSDSSAATRTGMSQPTNVALDATGRLWVADRWNNRVLRFDNAASKPNGGSADGVLGQINFTDSAPALARNRISLPYGVAIDGKGRLFVVDVGNNRILIFNSAAGLANGANASYVLGQTNFSTNTGGTSATALNGPMGVFYDQVTKVLLATDYSNSRVLMYGKPSKYYSSRSVAAYDGPVLESSETSNVGGAMNKAGSLLVGDDALNRQYRSLLYFDTAILPDTAMIRSVTLKIKKAYVTGTDPFSTLGLLLSDIKKGTFGAAALELTDFQSAASAKVVGHFNAVASQPGWYQLVLPAADYQFINLQGPTQFRVRFALDDNNNYIADHVHFYSGDAPTSIDRPLLYIEYTLP